jgi:LPS sulfotransferase NodH
MMRQCSMAPDKVSCLICATPRCGSTLLCEALRRSKLGGRPEEFFSIYLLSAYREMWKVSGDFSSYVRKAVEVGTTANNVFSAKIMWSDAQKLFQQLGDHYGIEDYDLSSMHELLGKLLPNLHYVYIERKDTLAQAVSYAKALQANVWIKYSATENSKGAEPAYNRRQIDYLLKEIAVQSLGWKTYLELTGVAVKRICYEDFSENVEATARDVLEYLGTTMPSEAQFTRRLMRQQSDDINAEWISRYKAGN